MKMGRLEKFFVNSPAHSRRVSRHAEEMLRVTSAESGQNYLDVGCGNGAAAIHIARNHKLHVIGVDIDLEQLRAARKSSKGLENIRFLALDAARLPFPGGVFDIVASNKVTHHIAAWEDALAEMIRVLKPSGFLIYSDLVFPRLLAPGASRIFKQAGFPTADAVRACAEGEQLALVHRLGGSFHQNLVWRKIPA